MELKQIVREKINEFINKSIIKECVITAVRLDDGIVLAKNRDRGYKAMMNVIHEIIDGVEVAYWHDIQTDWSEGMNEFGIGIINSSLLVHQDEKESEKVSKNIATIKPSYDGKKIRKALTKKNLPQAIKSIISYAGEDKKDIGVKGETIVANNKNIYVIEMTSSHSPIIQKLKDKQKLIVRTNHGIKHKNVGYTKGIKKKSSHYRFNLAKDNLKYAKNDEDVINILKKQYINNKFLNPYRLKNTYGMQTVGQIMMNLEEKKLVIRMDEKSGEYLGLVKRLPEGYEPKIKIVILNEP